MGSSILTLLTKEIIMAAATTEIKTKRSVKVKTPVIKQNFIHITAIESDIEKQIRLAILKNKNLSLVELIDTLIDTSYTEREIRVCVDKMTDVGVLEKEVNYISGNSRDPIYSIKKKSADPNQSPADVLTHEILRSDPIKVRLWKVMQDGVERVFSDIEYLVSKIDNTNNVGVLRSLFPKLSVPDDSPIGNIYSNNVWFVSRQIPHETIDSARLTAYRMLPGIPMPGSPAERRDKKTTSAAFETNPTSELDENTEEELAALKRKNRAEVDKAIEFLRSILRAGPILQSTIMEVATHKKISYEHIDEAAHVLKLHNERLQGFSNQIVYVSSMYPMTHKELQAVNYLKPLTTIPATRDPLIHLGVQVKERLFTTEQAEFIFGKGIVEKCYFDKTSMLKVNPTIKGIEFTTEEFEAIAKFLIKNGFGKTVS